MGILQSAGLIRTGVSEQFAFLGELALDGTINRIKGALPLIIGLRDRGIRRIVESISISSEKHSGGGRSNTSDSTHTCAEQYISNSDTTPVRRIKLRMT